MSACSAWLSHESRPENQPPARRDQQRSGNCGWRYQAGAYAIQGRFGAFIPWLQGSFTGVVGLPVAETAHLLEAAEMDIQGVDA
mgnify:CR=1 FL=1